MSDSVWWLDLVKAASLSCRAFGLVSFFTGPCKAAGGTPGARIFSAQMSRLLHLLRSLQIGLRVGSGQQTSQRGGALEGHQTRPVKPHQAFQRGLGVFVWVDLFDFPLVAHHLSGKQARSVQVEPAVEHLLVERIDGLGVLLRDVAVGQSCLP